MTADHPSSQERTRMLPAQAPSGDARPDTTPAPGGGDLLLSPGRRVGDYEVIGLIGEGGMGQVWSARHVTLHRKVALKTTRCGDGPAAARFAREAQLASTLDHAHIARLYEFSLDPPFIAFQLIEGAPITGHDARSIRALRDAAHAVDHAHQHGILHRDLKPDNLIVDHAGHAFVLDFGLARPLTGADAHLTTEGEIVGTPAYMSPEQANGDPHLTPLSDVYSLGAVLYTLLCGKPPYRGRSAWDIIRQVQVQDPPRPVGDRDLVTICLKAMARDPARRYASAGAFAADLGRWLQKEPVLARRAGIGYRLLRSVQKRPAVWGLAGALVSGSAIALVVCAILLLRVNRELGRAAAADRVALAAAADQQRAYALEGTITRAERHLADLDQILSRDLDEPALAQARQAVEAVMAGLVADERRWPAEGMLPCLRAEALLLLNREAEACAALDAALARPPTTLGAQEEVAARAHRDRAWARLRLRYADQMVRLFVLQDGGGYEDGARVAPGIADDLAQAGDHQDYAVQVLSLWNRYIAAAQDHTAGRITAYVAIHAQALALAAQGGRSDEWANQLAGITTPFPRTQAALACWDAAIRRSHNFAQAYLQRALELQWAGRDEEARADGERALRRRPGYGLAHLLIATLSHADEAPARLAEDLRHADAAVATLPQQPEPLRVRALLRWVTGAQADAIQDCLAAITVLPNHRSYANRGECWCTLAHLLAEAGLLDPARAAWRKASLLGDDRGVIEQAQFPGAVTDIAALASLLAPLLDRGGSALPVAIAARTILAERQLAANHPDAALAQAQAILQQVPQDADAVVLAAAARAATGRTPAAIAAAFSALDETLAHLPTPAQDPAAPARWKALAALTHARAALAVGDAPAAAAALATSATAPLSDAAATVQVQALAAAGDPTGSQVALQRWETRLRKRLPQWAAQGAYAEAEQAVAAMPSGVVDDAALVAAIRDLRVRRAVLAKTVSRLPLPR